MSAHRHVDLAPAHRAIEAMQPVQASDLIPLLQELQDAYGYLPKPVMETVTSLAGIPLSRVVGVATFYEQFSLTPRGRHIIRVCRGTACHVRGAGRIAEEVERCLGVGEGETTQDMTFTFYTVACLGTCFLSPVMMIDHNYYGQLTVGKVDAILNFYRSLDTEQKGEQ